MRGRERFGTVTHWRDRTPYKAYLIEVFDGARIYTMVGLASAENMPKYLPEFKKMAASYQPIPAD